jgi:AcrR family transcriptional regulator
LARKEEILNALLDIFKNQGVGTDFTISQLAAKVNIGKSTIYEYFKTKDDILKEAIYQVVRESFDMIYKRGSIDDLSFEEAFKSEMMFLFSLHNENRFLVNFLSPEFRKIIPSSIQAEFGDSVQEVITYYEKRFIEIFTKGIIEEIIPKENSVINTLLISSLISGTVMRYANTRVGETEDLNLEEYTDAIYQAAVKISN